MKEDEKIVAELKSRATDPEHEQALVALYRELLVVFENESAAGVTDAIERKVRGRREAYENAHSALVERIGLKQGDR